MTCGRSVVNAVNFLTAKVSAEASNWLPMDYRFGDRERVIVGKRTTTSKQVALEVKVSAYPSGFTGVSADSILATATVWTSANSLNNSCILRGAWTHARVRVITATGAATYSGVI